MGKERKERATGEKGFRGDKCGPVKSEMPIRHPGGNAK